MNKDQQFNINVSTNKDGVITILHGKAQDPEPRPKSIEISGTLTAPFNYYIGRKEILNTIKTQCHLIIDKDERSIVLVVDDKSGISTDRITGVLTTDERLAEWSINSSKAWTVRDFIKFIRPRKFMFAQGDQQIALIKELLEWHVKIEKEVKEFSDNRGNSLSSLETRVTQIKLMDSFQLNLAVFTGFTRKIFTVNIGVEATSNGVVLNLFSDDLATLTFELIDEYIGDEIKKFDDAGFDCSRIFK
jgi:hypothetical protein